MSKIIATVLAGVLMTSAVAVTTLPAVAVAQAAKVNFATTKISVLIQDAKAKAILEKTLPEITQYYDAIGEMTLTEVIPMSQGAMDEAKLKEMQAAYDKA